MLQPGLNSPYWALRIVYGVVPIVAGLDKFVHLLTDWTRYLADPIRALLPVSADTFMYGVGIVEIAAGLLVLSPATRFGAYLVGLWLLAIVANLIIGVEYWDVAVRDFVMAVGAFTLAKMSAVRRVVETPMARRVAYEPVPAGA